MPPPPSGSLNVLDFGATGDGSTDDSAAFQAAVDSLPIPAGGVIWVPAGDYRFGATVYLSRDNATLKGEDPSAAILRLTDESRFTLLRLPITPDLITGNLDPAVVVDGVTIEGLTIDGNLNPYPVQGPGVTDYYGVYGQQATDLTIRRCHFKDWHSDAVAFANGNVPNSATVEDCRFDRVARNAIHVGFVSSCTVRRCHITDTPTQHWEPSAGNGIDVEVEGYDFYGPAPHYPFVRNLRIEDCLLVLEPIAAASVAFNLQPAYGPLSDVIVQSNAIVGYQFGVQTTGALGNYGEVAGAHDIEVSDNWFGTFAGSATAGRALEFAGCAHVVATGNVINDTSAGADFSESGTVEVKASYDVAIADNVSWGSDQVPGPFVYVNYATDLVAITGNSYRCESGLAVYNDGTATNITATGNTDLVIAGTPAWDSTPPAVIGFSVAEDEVISSAVDIAVSASDAGSGVARVWFLVDGIPAGHSDTAPHTFAFDPADHVIGDHVLSARAIDGQAVLSDEVSVTVRVEEQPSLPGVDRLFLITLPSGNVLRL